MKNDLGKTSEIEMIPALVQIGAKLIKKTPNDVTFSYKDIEISIYLEIEYEVYGVVSYSKTKQSVYLSELLSDYLNIEDKAIFYLSKNFSIELCIKKLMRIILTEILPLIISGKIFEAMDLVISKRKEGLRKYYEGLIEKEAEEAFKEKRYADVISHYEQISELTDVQKKRYDISMNKINE